MRMSIRRRVAPAAIAGLVIFGLSSASVSAGTVKKSGPFYDVEISKSKKGNKSIATIKVTGKKGYHCNMLYPWKLTPAKAAGIAFDKPVYKKADAKRFTEQAVVFEVVYSASADQRASATLKMSLCNDKQCDLAKEVLEF